MKRFCFLFFFLLFIVAASFFCVPTAVLEITRKTEEQVLFRSKIREGESFSTIIRHSVHLTPVFENYKVNDKGLIVLTGTRLQDFGWGVPSAVSEDMELNDNFFEIRGLSKVFDSIPFRVSQINDPAFLFRGKKYYLLKLVPDGERIEITAKKTTLGAYIFLGGNIDAFSEIPSATKRH